MMDGLGQEQERDTCFHVVILSHKSYGVLLLLLRCRCGMPYPKLSVKDSASVDTFKCGVKKHLFINAYYGS